MENIPMKKNIEVIIKDFGNNTLDIHTGLDEEEFWLKIENLAREKRLSESKSSESSLRGITLATPFEHLLNNKENS